MEQQRPSEEEQPPEGEPARKDEFPPEPPAEPGEATPAQPPAAMEPPPAEAQEQGPAPAPEPAPEPVVAGAPEAGPPAAPEPAPGEPLQATPPPAAPAGVGVFVRPNLVAAGVAAGLVIFGTLMFLAGVAFRTLIDDDETVLVAGSTTSAGEELPAAAAATPVPPDVDDDPARGPEDAPIVMIEFSDFQCPFCARFFGESLPQILENYGDQIRFVYRDFPLTSIHPDAQRAAEAAQCAFEQDGFWEYHDLLFGNQSALDEASLKQYAEQVGLDAGAFADCLDSGLYTEEVQADLRDGLAAGVQGTPTFFINGQAITGARPYQDFEAVIEAALAAANQ